MTQEWTVFLTLLGTIVGAWIGHFIGKKVIAAKKKKDDEEFDRWFNSPLENGEPPAWSKDHDHNL